MTCAVGIDVGGTKVAAGLVERETGVVRDRLEVPTRPERGGAAVLGDCVALARALDASAPVGVGLCELVDLGGRPASADTVDWRGLDLADAFGRRVALESDVRAAALAEARFGAGAGRGSFLFAIVGTGASVCLVVDGVPHPGAHGHAIVLGAPPVERVASGPALAGLAGRERAEEVLADPAHGGLVDEAAAALGQVLAVLVNALDPGLVVLGGGLGSAPGFHERVERACRSLIAYPAETVLEVVPARLGADAGLVGAALCAAPA